MNPSLFLIKYDGFDCVYGLELHKDERVQGLEVLPDRLGKTELRTGSQRLNTVLMEGCTISLLVLRQECLFSCDLITKEERFLNIFYQQ